IRRDRVSASESLGRKRHTATGSGDVGWNIHWHSRAPCQLHGYFHKRPTLFFRLGGQSAHDARDTRREVNSLSPFLLSGGNLSGCEGGIRHPFAKVPSGKAFHQTSKRAHAADADHSFCRVPK